MSETENGTSKAAKVKPMPTIIYENDPADPFYVLVAPIGYRLVKDCADWKKHERKHVMSFHMEASE